jgi:hypothetical protein
MSSNPSATKKKHLMCGLAQNPGRTSAVQEIISDEEQIWALLKEEPSKWRDFLSPWCMPFITMKEDSSTIRCWSRLCLSNPQNIYHWDRLPLPHAKRLAPV